MKSLLENTISNEVDSNLLEVVIGGGSRILAVFNEEGILRYFNQGHFLPHLSLRQEFTGKSYTNLIEKAQLKEFENLLEKCRTLLRIIPNTKLHFIVDGNLVPLCIDELQYLPDGKKYVMFLLPPKPDIGFGSSPDDQYKALFVRNPMPMWIFEQGTFKFLEVNEAAITHYGYSREEFLGMTVKDIRPQEDLTRFINHTSNQIGQNNYKIAGVWRHIKKDGSVIYVDITSRMVGFNNTEAVLVLAKDITAQHLAEMELKQSEMRLRTLVNISDEVIVQLGPTGKVAYVSDNITRVLGYTVDEVLSNANFSLTHPDDMEMVKQATAKAFSTPGPSPVMEHRMLHKNGHYIWVESSSVNLLDAEGINGIVISLRDITEVKEGLDAIKENAETIATILDSIADSFYVIDKDWKVKYWNKAAETFIGKKRDEVMGLDIRDCFPSLKNNDSIFVKAFKRVMESRKAEHIEGFGETTQRWIDTSIYPAGDGLSVYFKDVTERKEQEAELNKLNEALGNRAKELASSNAELERFAYVASHDLQEPLRMVSSFMQLLKRKYENELDPIAQQYIYYAVDGAERMNQLILDLLQYSRVGTNKDNFKPVDLNEVLAQVNALYETDIANAEGKLFIGNMPTVKGIRTQLMQLFQNLIGNAIKYRSNVPLYISTSATEEENHWVISVTDNGIGIEEAYYDKIFVIFQRLHNKEAYSGTGIGLAVCKKIVERHGGKIWVKSNPGEGSTFYFTIPKN